jgi:hypothetical protein
MIHNSPRPKARIGAKFKSGALTERRLENGGEKDFSPPFAGSRHRKNYE